MPHVPPYLVLITSPAKNLLSFVIFLHPLWRVAIFTLLILTAALLAGRPAEQIFTHREFLFSQFANHRNLVLISSVFAVIALRLCYHPLHPVPAPRMHDEYSYLLMGDTF